MHKQQKTHLDIARYTKRLRQNVKDLRRVQCCPHCSEKTVDATARYCIICGAKTLSSGRVPDMIYKSIRLNENGKALVCPHCDNEELTPGDYCIICGSDLINRCADMHNAEDETLVVKGCGTVLPGNARYCAQCGNESSFYQRGWLKDWRSENTKKAIENINVTVDYAEIKKDKKEKREKKARASV